MAMPPVSGRPTLAGSTSGAAGTVSVAGLVKVVVNAWSGCCQALVRRNLVGSGAGVPETGAASELEVGMTTGTRPFKSRREASPPAPMSKREVCPVAGVKIQAK